MQSDLPHTQIMADKPLVSIIIPAYNVADYIQETLASVFEQSLKNIEIILVNDGSDDTEELENNIQASISRLTYITQNNSGAGAARNTGIRNATGQYIAFLDADDIWLPDYLEKQLKYLEAGGYDVVSANALIIEHPIYTDITYRTLSPCSGDISIANLLNFNCSPITSGTVVKRSALDRFGYFDPNISRGQDFDLWLRIRLGGGKLISHNEVLVYYRYRTTGLTGSMLMEAERTQEILRVVKEKYSFDKCDELVLAESMKKADLFLKLTEGKIALITNRYNEATVKFYEAQKLSPTFKMQLVCFTVKYFPRLSHHIYRIWRGKESGLLLSQTVN